MAYLLGGLFLLLLGAAILYSIAYWRLHAQHVEGVIIGIRRRGAYFHSDHVTVLYQPGKQDTAMIDRGMHNWEPVGGLLLLGAAFTTWGFVSRRARGAANHSKESRPYQV
jgi:hypothetical protein